jgi:hypothetical protein
MDLLVHRLDRTGITQATKTTSIKSEPEWSGGWEVKFLPATRPADRRMSATGRSAASARDG